MLFWELEFVMVDVDVLVLVLVVLKFRIIRAGPNRKRCWKGSISLLVAHPPCAEPYIV